MWKKNFPSEQPLNFIDAVNFSITRRRYFGRKLDNLDVLLCRKCFTRRTVKSQRSIRTMTTEIIKNYLVKSRSRFRYTFPKTAEPIIFYFRLKYYT